MYGFIPSFPYFSGHPVPFKSSKQKISFRTASAGDSIRDLFSPDRWRSLNPLKGSQNLHPKKVTAWITRQTTFHYENIRVGLPHEECHRIDRRQEHSIDLSIRESSLERTPKNVKMTQEMGSGQIGIETSECAWKSMYLPCEYFYIIYILIDLDAWMRWGYIFSCMFHTTPDPKPHPPHGEWDLQSSSFSACFLAFQVPQIAEEILLHDSRSCSCKLLIKY